MLQSCWCAHTHNECSRITWWDCILQSNASGCIQLNWIKTKFQRWATIEFTIQICPGVHEPFAFGNELNTAHELRWFSEWIEWNGIVSNKSATLHCKTNLLFIKTKKKWLYSFVWAGQSFERYEAKLQWNSKHFGLTSCFRVYYLCLWKRCFLHDTGSFVLFLEN